MNKHILILALFFIFFSVSIVYGVDTVDDFNRTVLSGITFEWKVVDDSLVIRLSAETRGWIAVGFNPTSMMNKANIIIGYVDNSGSVVVSDEYGVNHVSHKPDTDLGGTDDVYDIWGTEEQGVTTLGFTIPLNSGDSSDQPLEEGQLTKIILAYAWQDNLRFIHVKRGSVEVRL